MFSIWLYDYNLFRNILLDLAINIDNKIRMLTDEASLLYIFRCVLDLAFEPGVAGDAVDGHKGKNKWCTLDIGLEFGDRAIHFGLA